MFTHLKNLICSLFNIKACKCDDTVTNPTKQEIFLTGVPTPLHCGSHTRYIKSCPACIKITK
jgi:hypothetical protein